MTTPYHKILKAQRSCEVGQFAPKFITNCDYCGDEVWYEKGKRFFPCPDCGKTNYREEGK